MSQKRISPKRYIYENGNLVIKEMKDESNQISLKKKIIEEFYEVQPKKNYQSLLENYKSNNILNIKLQYPKLSPINNNQGNNKNNKIFSTEIDNKIGGSPRIEEIEKKIMMNYLKENDDNDNENDEDNDYNINNLKSLEINPSYIRRNPKFKRILEQSKISSQIEDICKYMYTSPRKNDEDNIRFKMHEKENEYIKHLTKNYLVDEDLIKKNSLRKNRGNNMIKKNISIESNFIPNNKNKNTSNSLNDDEIIKQYYDKQTSNTIDVEKLTSLRFENYSRNYPRYKHPKIYRLKSGNKIIKDSEKSLLPPIRNGGYNSIDLSDFIPVKKGITKPEQRKEYFHYKIMKNNRPEVFHL
jgi:hypothetical protein